MPLTPEIRARLAQRLMDARLTANIISNTVAQLEHNIDRMDDGDLHSVNVAARSLKEVEDEFVAIDEHYST
jgi:hypothetical protein